MIGIGDPHLRRFLCIGISFDIRFKFILKFAIALTIGGAAPTAKGQKEVAAMLCANIV